MPEAKYYRDYRQKYLIIKNKKTTENFYPCKMITSNRIKGLLPCTIKYINGEELMYYEIGSKQNLACLYENRTMGLDKIKELLQQFKMLLDRMQGFLLNESCLMLCPEYIFANVETGELHFLFYPFCEEEDSSIKNITEFLIKVADSEDREAVELVYKLFDLAAREQFVLDEILIWFEHDNREQLNQKHPETQQTETQQPEILQTEKQQFEKQHLEEQYCRKVSPESNLSGKTAKFLLAAGLAGTGILFGINDKYVLTAEETVYMFAGFIITGLLSAVSLGSMVYSKWGRKCKKQETKESDEEQNNIYTDTKEKQAFRETSENQVYQRVDADGHKGAEHISYGETVFIPFTESVENKLYSMESGNKQHIDLNKLPQTVGKLTGSVDTILNDKSISRMHARFIAEGRQVIMTDLNSTNGTFKNGLRIEPNASVKIEAGDEIRLGKLKFIYR